ncbi:MAG: hypothetical protein JNK63_10695 [Chthonomonas sp.]|nr:hypothetical protein [Chthonomonas sp.]
MNLLNTGERFDRISRATHCCYCGRPLGKHEVEKEHAVPECLLLRGTQPVLVPSCKSCNRKKSWDDEFLRDFLGFAGRGAGHQGFRAIRGAVLRSVKRGADEGRHGPVSALLAGLKHRDVVWPCGTLASLLCFPVDNERLARSLAWITLGLHYYETERRLSPRSSFWIVNDYQKNRDLAKKTWDVAPMETLEVGPNFHYKVPIYTDEGVTLWYFKILGECHFLIATNHDGEDSRSFVGSRWIDSAPGV